MVYVGSKCGGIYRRIACLHGDGDSDIISKLEKVKKRRGVE
jgi:hypothetical protein